MKILRATCWNVFNRDFDFFLGQKEGLVKRVYGDEADWKGKIGKRAIGLYLKRYPAKLFTCIIRGKGRLLKVVMKRLRIGKIRSNKTGN